MRRNNKSPSEEHASKGLLFCFILPYSTTFLRPTTKIRPRIREKSGAFGIIEQRIFDDRALGVREGRQQKEYCPNPRSRMFDVRHEIPPISTITGTSKIGPRFFTFYYLKYNQKFCIVVISQSPSRGGYEDAGTYRPRKRTARSGASAPRAFRSVHNRAFHSASCASCSAGLRPRNKSINSRSFADSPSATAPVGFSFSSDSPSR